MISATSCIVKICLATRYLARQDRVVSNWLSTLPWHAWSHKPAIGGHPADTLTNTMLLQNPIGTCSLLCTNVQMRFYNRRKTVKTLPTKPLNFDYGGDLTTDDYPVDTSEPRVEFDGVEEVRNVEETVQKLLSVDFGDGQAKMRRRIQDLVNKVKDHPLDTQSMEVIIAYQTVTIRNQIKHVLGMRKDKKAKSLLIMRLQARRRHLRRLRKHDYDKFLWLCEELKLKYIPVPEYAKTLSRRATLKAEARTAAIQSHKHKMELFKKQLEEEKVEFLQVKEKELVDIEEEMRTLGIEESSPMWRIHDALKQGDLSLLEQKTQPKRRRQLILEKKFELAELRAKEREKQE